MSITIRIKRKKVVAPPVEVEVEENPRSPLGWKTVKAWHTKDCITAEPIYLSVHKPERVAQIEAIFERKLKPVGRWGANHIAYQIWGVGNHVIVIDCGRELEESFQHIRDAEHSFADIDQSIRDNA